MQESNENELVIDYNYLFMTMELFKSREEQISWVHQIACMNNMIILIKRSDNVEIGRSLRVTLACERSGSFYESKEKVSRKNVASVGEFEVGNNKKKTRRQSMLEAPGQKNVVVNLHRRGINLS